MKVTDDELVAFIGGYWKRNGYPPSVRTIGMYFGWSSTATTHHHLRRLEKNELVERRGPARLLFAKEVS